MEAIVSVAVDEVVEAGGHDDVFVSSLGEELDNHGLVLDFRLGHTECSVEADLLECEFYFN